MPPRKTTRAPSLRLLEKGIRGMSIGIGERPLADDYSPPAAPKKRRLSAAAAAALSSENRQCQQDGCLEVVTQRRARSCRKKSCLERRGITRKSEAGKRIGQRIVANGTPKRRTLESGYFLPSFCQHGHPKRTCVSCVGEGICQHSKRQYYCKACKAAGVASASGYSKSL